MMYYYETHNYLKKFSIGSGLSFAPLSYSYPSSFPGINIFEAGEAYLDKVLGMTDSKVIILKKGLKELRDFVLFHEEEHVKDMSAGEMEIDRRALKRIKAKLTVKLLERIKELMSARWGAKAEDLLKELE